MLAVIVERLDLRIIHIQVVVVDLRGHADDEAHLEIPGRIAVGKKFQFGLRCDVARQRTDARQISLGNGIGNEHRTHAVEIKTGNVGRNIRFSLFLYRRGL